jgi:hypothetical protein
MATAPGRLPGWQPEAALEIDMSNLTPHEKSNRRAPAADDPPTVEVAIAWCERSKYWSLTVLRCPFCQGRHFHGGGDGETPDLGFRASHCATRESGTYELVPAAESEWAV